MALTKTNQYGGFFALGLAALALGLLALADEAEGQLAWRDIASAGPLDHVWIGNELSCQVSHTADPFDYQFYPSRVIPGDCGTIIASGSTLYGPNFASHGTTATTAMAITPWTPVSQSAVTGTGTLADPFTVKTEVVAPPPGTLRVEQWDYYVIGSEAYTTKVVVHNTGPAAVSVVIYRAGDCYLGGSDSGYGALDVTAPNSVACSKNPDNTPPGRNEEFIPITPGSKFYHHGFNTVWTHINTRTMFPDTCMCTTLQDNGAGLSWSFTIAAGSSVTVEQETRFGLNPVQANFDWSPDPPCRNGLVTFRDTSTTPTPTTLVSSTWDMGDGTTYTRAPWTSSITHTYSNAGTYTVTLKVKNSLGAEAQRQKNVDVIACVPTPDFTWSPIPACMKDPMTFVDTSTTPGGTTLRNSAWTFGDGAIQDYDPWVATTTHTYSRLGTYTVTLRVENSLGEFASIKKDVDVISCPPTADFGWTPLSVCHNWPVTFDDLSMPFRASSPIAKATWTFGDGTIVYKEPPTATVVHTFTKPGSYFVSLEVTDIRGEMHEQAHVVKAVNCPPKISPIKDYTVYELETVAFGLSGSDPNKDPIAFFMDRGPLPSTAQLEGMYFSWKAPKGSAGTYAPIQFWVADVYGASDHRNITITVLPGPDAPNPGSSDADADGIPDGQDPCPNTPGTSGCPTGTGTGSTESGGSDSTGDAGVAPPPSLADADSDGVPDHFDNCPATPNPMQLDMDRDGVGDACDVDLDGDGIAQLDADGRILDNCPFLFNPDQRDSRGHGVGDACRGDADGDGILDAEDPCPWTVERQCEPATKAPGIEPGRAPTGVASGASGAGSMQGWVWGAAAVAAVAAGVAVLLIRRRKSED
jgi:PKD repeat protein